MKVSKIQVIGNIAGLLPGAVLVYQYVAGSLSANPIQTATIFTGRSAIYAILVSLFCSPLKKITKMSAFLRIRKTAGLYGFFYAFVHFLIFVLLDYQANLKWILPELKQKAFLQIGLAALVLLIPLAATSSLKIRQKMGKWWKRLHYLIYGITALILLHVVIASKGDIIDPAILISLFFLAMTFRLPPLNLIKIRSLPAWLRDLNTYLIK